ncbi:MAG: tyrosine-protein phosphatase [Candidatus Sericytochromatia bacterium]|nr:tyrosine-protein phosphatase [Candidatus Sericytochromatia bacterium]
MKKILLFVTLALFSSGCSQTDFSDINNNVNLSVVEHEPNYVKTLSTDIVQTPSINNIYRFGKVTDKLYRGGLPTDSDLQALKTFGIKTVISFRGLGDPTEPAQVAQEKIVVEKLGMKFLNVQVPFDKSISDPTIKTFFNDVNSVKNQPLYVHCKGGRDRTGTMIALYRIKYNGYKPEQAIEEMKQYTFNPADYPIFTKQIMSFSSAKIK